MTASDERLEPRKLALRRWLGSIALAGGVLVTVSTSAPYIFVRTDVPLVTPSSGNEGATLRVRDVLVLLPPPSRSIERSQDWERAVPWDAAPVLTLLNESKEPVVLRTARASLVVGDAAYRDPQPRELSIEPGERRSVRLTLRRSRESAIPSRGYDGRFCLGELVFPDGTSQPIVGELWGLQDLVRIGEEGTLAPPGGVR